MKWLFTFFKRKSTYTKEDLLSFAEFWHCKQSSFGYEGELEKLFMKWESKRLNK